MAEFKEVFNTRDIQDGEMKEIKVDGRDVLLARVKDNYYAADSRCPHMGGNLSQGTLEGTVVTCPRHRSRFDLTDGHVVRWTDWRGVGLTLVKVVRPPRAIKIYRVKIEGDKILVETGKVPTAAG